MTDADELRRRARQHEHAAEETDHSLNRWEHEGIAEGYRRAADQLETPPVHDTIGHRTRRAETHTVVETSAADTLRRRTYQPSTDPNAAAELVTEEYHTSRDEWHIVGRESLTALVINGETVDYDDGGDAGGDG
jgi:hypothetical protein